MNARLVMPLAMLLGCTGDTYLRWEGGPSYWSRWPHGPSSDPRSFPIAVWLQSPSNAPAYRAIGVNTFIGLYAGADRG